MVYNDSLKITMTQEKEIDLVVTSPSFSKNPVLQRLAENKFPGARLNVSGRGLSGACLAEFVGNARALIVGLEKIDVGLLNSCHNLKAIAKFGVGLDNVDLEECRKRGVEVCWSGGVNRISVAEMVLGFMLMLCRNLYVSANQVKNGVWIKSGGCQLTGKKVGIIGFGSIGREVARLLGPFNCEILANDIMDIEQISQEMGVKVAEKDEIYAVSDFVTIHTPLTPLTRNLIDSKALQKMKSSAFVINTSRGGIINQEDLKFSLKNKTIGGAALDVFESEPELDKELFEFPNLIGTPHIGGNAQEAVEAMGRIAIENLVDFFQL